MAGDHDSPSGQDAAGANDPFPVRHLPFGPRPARAFALAVALPALLFYVAVCVVVIFSLVFMAREIDRMEEQRGLTTMAAALENFLSGISSSVADEGTWNEAHLRVVIKPDLAWMDGTWGTTARLAESYDDAIVTDNDGRIIFGENEVGAITGNIAEHYPSAAAMLAELDQAITASGDAAVVAHFAAASKGVTAALAAISIHKSTPGEIAVPRHQRRILWIAKHLTPAILQDIAIRYQVPLPRLAAAGGEGLSSLAILDAGNNLAGTVAWIADEPGEAAFRQTALIVSAFFVVSGIALLLGLRALRHAMMRRALAVDSAFVEQQRDSQLAVAAAEVAHAEPVAEARDTRFAAIEGVSASDFSVDYQPVFDLRSEELVGVETQARWNRPDRSIVRQEDLSAAECAAMMERAGIVVLRHAAGELAPLLGVTLSLTISPEQLMSEVFAEKVGGTLGATNFQIRRLQLTVDAALLPDADLVAPHVAELRAKGVAIALANFALDERTAQYLRPGLADRICLARSLVAGIDTDPVRLRLAEATIASARAAGFAVTVPFVERTQEASKLLRLGCHEFRGPLLAAPVPIGALTALVLAPPRPARSA